MLPGKKYTPEDILQILRRRIWILLVPIAIVGAGALWGMAGLRVVRQFERGVVLRAGSMPRSARPG